MNKNEIGKIASAAVAAAAPALAGYAVSALRNAYANGQMRKPAAAPKVFKNPREQILRNAPIQLSTYQPLVSFRTAAPITKGASVRLTGCDYVGTISAQVAAFDNVYEVTPKNATLFPRLSAITPAFELYKFLKIKPVMVGVSASTIPGAMSLSPDLYPDGSSFTIAEARNEEGSQQCKFWETKAMDFPCVRGTRQWFLTDNAGIAVDNDAKLGDLHLVTDAVGSAIPVCDLYIEYDIEFAQGQAITTDALMRSELLNFLSRQPGFKELLTRFALQLLPPDEREKWDAKGMRIRPKKDIKLIDFDEAIQEMAPADLIRVREPSPVTALPSRVLKTTPKP